MSSDLPNKEQAFVPENKLAGYLLSEAHAIGKSKAKFFRSLGFDATNTHILHQSLLEIAHTAQVSEVEITPHGTKYALEAEIQTPIGKSAKIRTIWIIETATTRPRFVTAYPAKD